jgi:peroxin-6
MAPAILHLRRLGAVKDQQSSQQKSDPSAVGFGLRDLVLEANRLADAPVLLVASCDDLARVPAELRAVFTHTVGMGEVPDLTCRTRLFEHFMAGVSADPGLSKTLALKTAGLTAGDINGVVADAGRYAVVRTQPGAARGERKVVSNASERAGLQGQKGKTIRASLDSILRGRAEWNRKAKVVKKMTAIEFSSSDDDDDAKEKDMLKTEDFESALDVLTERLSHQSGTSTAKIPDVKWDDVGGLENVKAEILDTIELPLKNPELFASGMRQRSGILLYGPPGTGKTLIAKAVASECSLNFISVKGPELLNMYIGESEKNVREVFERARACKPCVLFFDEIDSLAPARGQGSDSGGVMDRVVSQLLTELDGMNSNQDVFLIAATNRPDLLDSALLRPGRLDRCVYLGVSSTNEAQLNVVQALSRKFNLSEDCDLMQVVEKCPFTFSGADMYALCSDAMLNALKRKMEALEVIVDELRAQGRAQTGEESAVLVGVSGRDVLEAMTDDEIRVEVTMADWMAAKDALTPSLSQDELDHYKQLQSQFSGDRKL